MNVVSSTIVSGADPAAGYVIVQIPESPAAPHMIDKIYYGRGDKTKVKLSDAEVLRLHQRRRIAEQDVLDLLNDEITNDPFEGEGQQSHLFLVAQPVSGRSDMLLEFTSGENWNNRLFALIERAYTPDLNAMLANFESNPDLRLDATTGYRRARGAARATRNLGEVGRAEWDFGLTGSEVLALEDEKKLDADAIELQVHEDGGLRLYCSRFSALRTREQMIFDWVAVSLTLRFLAIVVAAAGEADYVGNWALAFGATRLRGRRAFNPEHQGSPARYSRDDYSQATATTWAELNNAPGAITGRLVGSLLRSLGTERRGGYAPLLAD